MKKFITIVLTLMLALVMFVACDDKPETKPEYNVFMPDGAPALSLVSQFDKAEIAGYKVNFTVVPASAIATYSRRKKLQSLRIV